MLVHAAITQSASGSVGSAQPGLVSLVHRSNGQSPAFTVSGGALPHMDAYGAAEVSRGQWRFRPTVLLQYMLDAALDRHAFTLYQCLGDNVAHARGESGPEATQGSHAGQAPATGQLLGLGTGGLLVLVVAAVAFVLGVRSPWAHRGQGTSVRPLIVSVGGRSG